MRGKNVSRNGTNGKIGVVEEYFNHQKIYQDKYGDLTCVIMQKGVFYEIYEYDPSCDTTNPNIHRPPCGHARDISSHLNMTLSSSDKNQPHSYSNPFMMGFPKPKADHHISILLDKGYTIVRIDEDIQSKTETEKNVPRKVVEIISPGTNINSEDISANTSILCIYIEFSGNKNIIKLLREKKSRKKEDNILTQIRKSHLVNFRIQIFLLSRNT